MRTQMVALVQLIFSTVARAHSGTATQSEGRQSLTTAALSMSGGHEIRTRNPLRGITFPV
jgi:hypothetical protein